MSKPERPASTGERIGAVVGIGSGLFIWSTGFLIIAALVAMVVVRL